MSARRVVVASFAALAVIVPALAVIAGLAGAHPYVVRPGDTLSEVAERLGVPTSALVEANGIEDPDLIVAGQLLVVPTDGGWSTDYVVKAGDTLSRIAHELGVPVADLARANAITDVNLIIEGRILAVPGLARPGAGRHTVQKGENLTAIATRLGVSASDLAHANGLRNPDLLRPGQVLVVPGRWQCPVPGATFVNDYGYVKPDGSRHDGVDLFAPRGAPVLAPVAGNVTQFPNPKGGRAVHLHTSDGTRYYFAHLDSYGETGQVAPGAVIGAVGTSGDAAATSPHLHFEIHPHGGESTNPFPSLVAACR